MKSVEEVLTEAIGEKAAGAAIVALKKAAKELRENRRRARACIIFDEPNRGDMSWAKVVVNDASKSYT